MKAQPFTMRIKHLMLTAAVLLGLTLVVGATINLPVSAQGLVTGRNAILIEQLVDHVGAQELVEAAADAGIVSNVPQLIPDNDRPRQNRSANRADEDHRHENRPGRNQRRQSQRQNQRQNQRQSQEAVQLNGNLEDQLERLGPEAIYQVAVDAGLITQAEASRMLAQQ